MALPPLAERDPAAARSPGGKFPTAARQPLNSGSFSASNSVEFCLVSLQASFPSRQPWRLRPRDSTAGVSPDQPRSGFSWGRICPVRDSSSLFPNTALPLRGCYFPSQTGFPVRWKLPFPQRLV